MHLLHVDGVDLAVAEPHEQVFVGETVRGDGVVQSTHGARQRISLLHGDGRHRGVGRSHLGRGGGGAGSEKGAVAASTRGCERSKFHIVDHALIQSSGGELRPLSLNKQYQYL